MKIEVHEKNRKAILGISLVAIAAVCIFLLASGAPNLLTGLAAGGQTTNVGSFSTGNPYWGVAKGNVRWVIYDTDSGIIADEDPTDEVTVYFVPQGTFVDWEASITCDDEIHGNLKHVDADDAGENCIRTDYYSPTAYECEAVGAEGNAVEIYMTNTSLAADNEGCFVARIPGGDYEIYI